ncbi:MAG: PepSY domain-containing protein [Deferribacteraceae bacterium]|jgi:hypothetical protein|nr:PepSY domain-containing protein [Deferribacteraceae bacterium]
MKKLFVLAAVVAFAMVGVSAFAQGGFGGMGGGNGNGYGHGYGHNGGFGGGGCWNGNGNGNFPGQNAPATITSEEDALKAVNGYMAENLKGYKTGNVTSFNRPMGTAYSVEATDASGNKFFFIVTPYGAVRGPIQGNQGVWNK